MEQATLKTNQLIFDHERLHRDLLVRLNQLKLNQRQIKPISRATLFRMSKGKPITIETMLKCIEWLDKEPKRYIYYKRIPLKQMANVK